MACFATPYGLRYAAHCFNRADAQNNRPALISAGAKLGVRSTAAKGRRGVQNLLDGPVTGFLAFLNTIYTPSVAFLVSMALVTISAIKLRERFLQNAGILYDLAEMNNAIKPVREAAGPDEARDALASAYNDIASTALKTRELKLRLAWEEFSESIVDPLAKPLSSSMHSEEFFKPIIEQSRGLLWWANIMVAIGLVFTFLGIMAALGNTAIAISNAGDSASMQTALQKLLNVTAAKFMTSFAGVGCSIALRFGDRHFQNRIGSEVRSLVDALERGLVYIPPQRIAAEQLRQLEQIALAQTRFAQDLAVAIGEKLNEQMTPMVTVLGDINSGIRNLKDELVGGVGGAVAETLGETAGREMQALAGSLAEMTERLGTVPEQIGASTEQANAKLENAAELFSQAAAGMQSAFDALGERIRRMGEDLLERQETASQALKSQMEAELGRWEEVGQRNREAMVASEEGLRALMTSMGATLEGIRSSLAAQAEESVQSTEAMVKQSQAALEKSVRGASEGLSKAANEAAKIAADKVAGAIEHVMDGLSQRVEAAVGRLIGAIDAGTTRVQAFGGSIERASASADSQAAKLATAGDAAERVSTLFERSAREAANRLNVAGQALADAAQPIKEATTSIGDSVAEIRELMRTQREQLEAQVKVMRELARQFEATSSAAQAAWTSYQQRFDDVDQALGNALRQMAAAAAESAKQITEYANKFDSHLGDAVNRFAAAIDELDDLPDAIREAAQGLTG